MSARAAAPLEERELTALWLLGRVPTAALPWTVLRAGRAGGGAGPDVREAAFLLESGVAVTGDVEVHLRASDFTRHGHDRDEAYARVRLHLVWEDDRAAGERGSPTALAGGGAAPTVAVAAALRGDPAALRARVRRGPAGREPCTGLGARLGGGAARELVRGEGRRRLAERAWRASRLAEAVGWEETWARLLDRALQASAGRRREDVAARARLGEAVSGALGAAPLARLAALALAGEPAALVEAVRGAAADAGAEPPALGRGRAAEVGWNAALPLLIALAAAYERPDLARATAALAARWPAPRGYGRTRALASRLAAARDGGALFAQGLLHVQELWCERAGCGECPCSRPPADVSGAPAPGAAGSGTPRA